MALYRATPKLISRIMTGRVPARAFVVGQPTNNMGVPNGAPYDNATPGSPGVTNHIAGLQFRDQIDPSTGSFSMPTGMGPVEESIQGQPTVRCEIQAPHIHELGGNNAPLPGGPIFMNRYFEADFQNLTASITSYLVQNGWFSAAGSLTNASVAAARNTHLPGMESRSGSRTGVY